MTFAIILIVVSVLFLTLVIVAMVNGPKNKKQFIEKLKKSGVDIDSKIHVGKFVGGHPEINEPFDNSTLYLKKGDILIAHEINYLFEEKATIENKLIKSINVLDSSTVEKNITLGRVLLVGVFALAWKKNKKNEMYFLEIKWNDDRFDNSTLFCFEGYESLTRVNTARNALINGLKK